MSLRNVFAFMGTVLLALGVTLAPMQAQGRFGDGYQARLAGQGCHRGSALGRQLEEVQALDELPYRRYFGDAEGAEAIGDAALEQLLVARRLLDDLRDVAADDLGDQAGMLLEECGSLRT